MKVIRIKAVVYTLVFVAATVLTYIFTIGKPVYTVNTSGMKSAGLPVIYMTTEEGIKYNYLHGYTGDVNELLMRDAITPIDDSRKLTISVKQYGTIVSGVSYELGTTDGKTLIERGTLSGYSGYNGIVTADFEFKNLLENGKEYLLKIILKTESYDNVSYFTRIIKLDTPNVQRKLSYINDFSENTRTDENLKKVTAKLETNSTGDNTNLGRVNIHSKLSQVGFSDLVPKLTTDRYFTITEIDDTKASVSVTYKAETMDESGSFSYNIKEYYRIYQPDETVTYVYNFDRFMNQIFNPKIGISGRGEVYLGIRSDTDITMKNSSNGNISAFVLDGNLWSFSAVKDNFTRVFSFENDASDGFREEYQAHDIKILNVYNNGSVDFIVYGYMNRGVHEGELGISVCKYDATEGTTSEIAYIPRNDSYELIARDVNRLSYLNDKNILYIYSNNLALYLDCSTKEYMVIADDILEDVSSMCEEKGIFVYQTGSDIYGCSELNTLYMDSGEIRNIKAEDEEYIRMLGYIDNNIVYGEFEQDMLIRNDDGTIISPMYKVTIMDSDNRILRKYGNKSQYVTEAYFNNSQIIFDRVEFNEEGEPVEISSDSILSNIEDTALSMGIVTRATEFRQKEQYISLVVTGLAKDTILSTKYVYPENTTVMMSELYYEIEDLYFAYGFGELYYISNDFAETLTAASESGGVVVDSNTRLLWNRYKPKSYEISLPDDIFGLNNESKASKEAVMDALFSIAGKRVTSGSLYARGYTIPECMEYIMGDVVDLSGSDIDMALYFVGEGRPIIAKTGNDKYELVYAYNTTGVYTCDFEENANKFYSKSDFNKLISQFDSIMISY